MVLAATLTVPAVVFATALPASALNNHLKETSGSYRVGAPDLALYQPVKETSAGRNVDVISAITVGANAVYIKFSAPHNDLCVAAADNGTGVVIHACNGGNGIVWFISSDANGHNFFESKEFRGTYLAGHNNGTQFQLKPNPTGGWFERFDITG
jgi:hypothetical protein